MLAKRTSPKAISSVIMFWKLPSQAQLSRTPWEARENYFAKDLVELMLQRLARTIARTLPDRLSRGRTSVRTTKLNYLMIQGPQTGPGSSCCPGGSAGHDGVERTGTIFLITEGNMGLRPSLWGTGTNFPHHYGKWDLFLSSFGQTRAQFHLLQVRPRGLFAYFSDQDLT